MSFDNRVHNLFNLPFYYAKRQCVVILFLLTNSDIGHVDG